MVGNRTTVLHWRCVARLCRPAAPPPPPAAHRFADDCGRQVDSIGFDSCPTSPTVSLIGGQSDNCSILGARRAFAVPPSHRTAAPPLPAAARRLAGETLDAKSTQPISLPPLSAPRRPSRPIHNERRRVNSLFRRRDSTLHRLQCFLHTMLAIKIETLFANSNEHV